MIQSGRLSSKYHLADQPRLYQQAPNSQAVSLTAGNNDGKVCDKDVALEKKQEIFMTAFAGHLKAEGLHSPHYYHDKSQCLSFHESASPAEMGYLKARSLKHGYVEPEELINRLRELKPSDNFTLRKYRHPRMHWGKSPILETPFVTTPPKSEWYVRQVSSIVSKGIQIGEDSSKPYKEEAKDHWDKVSNIELCPLPDLHLLKHMGRSPSGTLFPRYLVKGLRKLRRAADSRGMKYYIEEYERAKLKREGLIKQWQDKNSDTILADDPFSIYRTWPAELMSQLDAADCEGIQRGCARYMADLCETEGKMQLLVTFWNDCGLVTGQRTPPSPQRPDPKAKLRGVSQPQYLKDRLQTMSMEYQQHKSWERYKRDQFIEITRWKEAIMNNDTEPSASDTPLSQSLLDELDIVWQDYDNFNPEETEDEMIMKIAHWRKSKSGISLLGLAQFPSLTNGTLKAPGETRSPHLAGDSCSLDHKQMRSPPSTSQELKDNTKLVAQPWSGRLRPGKQSHRPTSTPLDKPQGAVKRDTEERTGPLRPRKQSSRPTSNPPENRQGVVKRGIIGSTRDTELQAVEGVIYGPEGLETTLSGAGPRGSNAGTVPKTMPLSCKAERRSKRLQHRCDVSSTAQAHNVTKIYGRRRNAGKAPRRGDSGRNRELLDLLTTPETK